MTSISDERLAKVEARMSSGQPFTYSEIAAVNAAAGGNEGKDRLADKTIQRWRRRGWIEMRGRRGRAPLWHLVKGAADAALSTNKEDEDARA